MRIQPYVPYLEASDGSVYFPGYPYSQLPKRSEEPIPEFVRRPQPERVKLDLRQQEQKDLDEAWEEVNRIAPGLDTRSPQQIASRPPSSFHLNLVQEPRRGGLHLHIRP